MPLNSASEFSGKDTKDYVFVTSIPWPDFTSIQHAIHTFKNTDIPSIASGKFITTSEGKISMPFSVQAHRGFVDGFHIHQLGIEIEKSTQQLIIDVSLKKQGVTLDPLSGKR